MMYIVRDVICASYNDDAQLKRSYAAARVNGNSPPPHLLGCLTSKLGSNIGKKIIYYLYATRRCVYLCFIHAGVIAT